MKIGSDNCLTYALCPSARDDIVKDRFVHGFLGMYDSFYLVSRKTFFGQLVVQLIFSNFINYFFFS